MPPETTGDPFDLVKYILVLATLPLWGPFAKALWDEFTTALRADGGLHGPELTPRQRRAVEEEIEATEDLPQVHEPIAHLRGAPTGPSATGRRVAPPGRPAARVVGGPQAGSQRRAFASGPRTGRTSGNRRRFRS